MDPAVTKRSARTQSIKCKVTNPTSWKPTTNTSVMNENPAARIGERAHTFFVQEVNTTDRLLDL